MTQYVLAYIGGNHPTDPEEGAKHRADWMAWVEGLGDAVVNPGTPRSGTQSVTSGGVSASSSTMSGFSIVEADSIEAAIEMAKSCPFLDIDGTIDVSQVMQMGG